MKKGDEFDDKFMCAIALHENNYVSTYADFDFIEKWKVSLDHHMPKSHL